MIRKLKKPMRKTMRPKLKRHRRASKPSRSWNRYA